MPPPRETNLAYYAEDLPASMKTEAVYFFRDLLANDGTVARFIDADYTFVDKKLAKLYDLPEQKTLRLADGFQKVVLRDNSHRGGLLGMAAVLTVSANGVETSPVTRGVWVSENILGIQPPPPPDEVPAIEPDVSGATNIRERLAKHRADVTCAECHRKIDPLGFSLESFDPVGRWRTKYPVPSKSKASAIKIDCSGEFPSGETYQDFTDFKKIQLKINQLISKNNFWGTTSFKTHVLKISFLCFSGAGIHAQCFVNLHLIRIWQTGFSNLHGLLIFKLHSGGDAALCVHHFSQCLPT